MIYNVFSLFRVQLGSTLVNNGQAKEFGRILVNSGVQDVEIAQVLTHQSFPVSKFMTDFNRDFIQDPGLYELWDRGSRNSKDLSQDEYQRFSNLNLNAFWFFSASFYQLQVGKLTPGDLFELEQIMAFWLSRPGIRDWWSKFGSSRYNADFVAYIRENYESSADA